MRIALATMIFFSLFSSCVTASTADEDPRKDNSASTVTKDNVASVRAAAEKGDPHAETLLGDAYDSYDGIVGPHDYEKAFSWYKKAAEQGDARAAVNLGAMYHNGHGTPKDDKEAVKWFQISASKNYSVGQNYLGSAYNVGIGGLPKDDKKSFELYALSAKQGDSYGQAALGIRYRDGMGVSKDLNQSMRWFKQSAEQNNPVAFSAIGYAYHEGIGVGKDDVEAVKWWKKAAEQGDSGGTFNLGCAYWQGLGGLPVDYVQAYKWLDISFTHTRNKKLFTILEAQKRVEAKMTREQIGEAIHLIDEWNRDHPHTGGWGE